MANYHHIGRLCHRDNRLRVWISIHVALIDALTPWQLVMTSKSELQLSLKRLQGQEKGGTECVHCQGHGSVGFIGESWQ